jgi:DNA ligase-1
MLAPNGDPNLDTLRYPVLASHKLDGVRFLMFDGKMYSRNMESLHPAVTKRFQPIIEAADKTGVCLDGEIWAHGLAFNKIVSAMADFEMCVDLRLHIFDILTVEERYAEKPWTPFRHRIEQYVDWCSRYDSESHDIVAVQQCDCNNAGQVLTLQQQAQKDGWEGLMLKCPNSVYAHRRVTAKKNEFWKLKFWDTINCVIVGFKQMRQLTDEAKSMNAERSALGRLKRGHRQDDRETVNRIGSVEVEVIDGQVFESGTRFYAGWSSDAPDVRAAMTWDNREQFLGKNAEVVYQGHGSKDKPRMGRIVRLRPDLD